ncbi:hypothetical protein GN330_06100 [Nitratireductor sp. CAU 1489]|uniref:Lipid-A-disaccharide synthase n=1 Tax=Nitratireductor arenosus TaxID=2682096 RepID=A0A844QGA5_9HYPH|nr:lipid-A-disaccharide synthase-related protein [Nitratireductor arenosus]MVA96819.1 hypothetical protein [Nitratireductor arenosus]
MKDVLFLGNGHGEDTIAVKVLKQLRAQAGPDALAIEAWPMVGAGNAFRKAGVPVVGALNTLPSEGFATLDWSMMWRDLQAGWIATHWRQVRAARAMAGRYRVMVAVGDIVPIAAAVLARTPFYFVGSAKSSYYDALHGYTGLEKRLLRRHCLTTFPRDAFTVSELERARVPTLYLGNPMMDELDVSGRGLGVADKTTVVAMLPGSRADATENLLDLLEAAASVAPGVDPLCFAFALHPDADLEATRRLIAEDPRAAAWRPSADAAQGGSGPIFYRGPAASSAMLATDAFADILHRATLAVGMAGTANEQAIGLGLPLITVPGSGSQGEKYVRMKIEYFGPAAVAAARRPEAIAGAVSRLLADPQARARMQAAGRERMGEPGASRAIAGHILAGLASARLRAVDGATPGKAA